MTIEKLLKVLRPFYVEWANDNEGWDLKLVALHPPRSMFVGLRDGVVGEEEATHWDPGSWVLGIDNFGTLGRVVQEIAQIEVDPTTTEVRTIRPHSTVPYSYVGPLLRAALAVDEIRQAMV